MAMGPEVGQKQSGWRRVGRGERGSGSRGYRDREGIGEIKSDPLLHLLKLKEQCCGLRGRGRQDRMEEACKVGGTPPE